MDKAARDFNRDPLVWLSLAAGVGFTASAEYELARTIGAVPAVAVLLPLALDVYAIAAIRRSRGRDIALSLTLMGIAQVAAHILEARVAEVSVPLVAAVSLLVPLSIWRVHALAVLPPKSVANSAADERQEEPDKKPPPGDEGDRQDDRQEPPPDDDAGAKKPPDKRRRKPRAGGAKKAPRRSMGKWVEIGEPVFHAEFKRLRRQPTGSEFAEALEKAGYGKPSESTAKNIRTEILDRAPLPDLED